MNVRDLSKLKLIRMCKSEAVYANKYPKLGKIASDLTPSLIFGIVELPLTTVKLANELDVSKFPYTDVTLAIKDMIKAEERGEGSGWSNINIVPIPILIRLIKLNEHQMRCYYYYSAGDGQSYTNVFSAILDDREIGLLGDVNMNDQINTQQRGFHPGVISISTFDTLINAVQALTMYRAEVLNKPALTHAFKKRVPAALWDSYNIMQVLAKEENLI